MDTVCASTRSRHWEASIARARTGTFSDCQSGLVPARLPVLKEGRLMPRTLAAGIRVALNLGRNFRKGWVAASTELRQQGTSLGDVRLNRLGLICTGHKIEDK